MTDVELQEQKVPLKSAEHPQAEGAESAADAGQQNATDGGGGGAAVDGTDAAAATTTKSGKKEKKGGGGGGWFKKKAKAPEAASQEPRAEGEGEAAAPAAVDGGAEGGEGVGGGGGANNVNGGKKQQKQKQKAEGGVAASGKKCPFSLFFCTQKCAAGAERGGDGEGTVEEEGFHQPSFQLNMVQRDDRKLHEVIDLGVEQIFGEPDAVHSLNGIWRMTNTVFLSVRNFFYKLLSLLFAVPLAIVFGVLFALVSVLGVYVFVPVGRLLSIPLGWLAKIWSVIVAALLDPVCRSCGLILGNVRVSRYGINQDPTAVLSA